MAFEPPDLSQSNSASSPVGVVAPEAQVVCNHQDLYDVGMATAGPITCLGQTWTSASRKKITRTP